MKNNVVNIGGRLVGPDYPPLVIAEIGINHNGSLVVAKQMVDAAVAAGAEVIKHQTHIVEDEMAGEAKRIKPGNADKPIYNIMEECALNEADEIALQEYVQAKGAIFISTPFSRAAVERLERMNVQAYKIGSGECNNYPLIKHIAKKGKPIILSTGMNTIESIRKAVAIFREYKIPYALMHCTNIYPTPPELVRLEAVRELQQEFPDAVVGLSDHTLGNYACLGAVALGADLLERHFTDSMTREGPDIVCSMDPQAMSELIKGSALLHKMRGGRKGIVKEEQPTINFAYATVVTIKPVKKGEKFTEDNLWVKRPGTGEILAEFYDDVIGKVAAEDIEADQLLAYRQIEGFIPVKGVI
ncbi:MULTISPECIES: N-acetylneuraminate synthase family protein [Cellvibrio]|uniref:N-acetylneuraminate synthase n=1 Tax=Cellvibrio fibrivorans TaxID=126350 RepID=A0ABU1UW47_9GAMM|nr:N-acetylneuraminate synthase family protein [Cellvibrio fibrivorans]MDR7089419.1 N-acetylneuraminate synthase [Cellvibrio fibrivorans]